jgi:hypothetical protein
MGKTGDRFTFGFVWDSDLMKALLNEQNIKTNNW